MVSEMIMTSTLNGRICTLVLLHSGIPAEIPQYFLQQGSYNDKIENILTKHNTLCNCEVNYIKD